MFRIHPARIFSAPLRRRSRLKSLFQILAHLKNCFLIPASDLYDVSGYEIFAVIWLQVRK